MTVKEEALHVWVETHTRLSSPSHFEVVMPVEVVGRNMQKGRARATTRTGDGGDKHGRHDDTARNLLVLSAV